MFFASRLPIGRYLFVGSLTSPSTLAASTGLSLSITRPLRKKFLTQKNHSSFDGKILDLNCLTNFCQKVIVYMFSLIYLLFGWIFTRSMFPIELLCNIDDSNSYILFQKYRNVWMIFLDHDYLHICIWSTIFQPMVTLWQPPKNKKLLRT